MFFVVPISRLSVGLERCCYCQTGTVLHKCGDKATCVSRDLIQYHVKLDDNDGNLIDGAHVCIIPGMAQVQIDHINQLSFESS